jgi:hypothetical protein
VVFEGAGFDVSIRWPVGVLFLLCFLPSIRFSLFYQNVPAAFGSLFSFFASHSKLTPFGTNWKKGSGATPFTMRGLEIQGAISIPTAPTKTPIQSTS